MSDPANHASLLRALGSLVRGLSALFWGLPLALIVCIKTSVKDKFDLQSIDFMAPVAANALLLFGLYQLGRFQSQERVWTQVLDRARVFGLVNLGLSPFIFWKLKLPDVSAFSMAVALMAASGLLFLCVLNQVLRRLVAMLPDQGLRQETALFTTLNQYLLLLLPLLAVISLLLEQSRGLPFSLVPFLTRAESYSQWLCLFVALLPVAMTMAMIWKIKEVILNSVFDAPKA